MPIDINLLRTYKGGDPEKVRESQRRRFAPVEIVDEIIALDDKWRAATGDVDEMKKDRNTLQKEVGKKMKAKVPCDEDKLKIKSMGELIAAKEEEKLSLKELIEKKIGTIGNIIEPSMNVPVHKDEAFNKVERTWGEPRSPEGLLNHHDLLWRIGGYEPDRGVNVAGHRGYFLRDVGVMLNQAFINYGSTFLRKKGYTVLQPPYLMKKDVMSGVAQLEQFDEELYKVSGGENSDDKYLIATSEQPICVYHKDEWLQEKELPIRYSGISTCFRKEAGKHGADTWGIFRVHQFEKVEQFVIVEGDLEKSNAMQEEMIRIAEEFYQSLGFPYHVINLVTGDLNNAAIRKYDLECWFPGYNAYRELVSCSNCTDYQSRSMEIRCGQKKMGDREKKYVHMLNSTLCATGRAICCLLENFQEEDGVRIPEVLRPYMDGMDFLPFVRGPRPEGKGEKSSKAAVPKSAPTPVPPAPATSTDPKVLDLEAQVAAKGDEVRKAKAEKQPKEAVMALVDELKALKVALADAGGAALPEPPKKDKKKGGAAPATGDAKKAEEEKKKPARGPAPDPPKYTTPAPAADPTLSALPGSVWEGVDVVSTEKLEKWLAFYSFVGGYTPTADDVRALRCVGGVDARAGANTARWMRTMKSYSEEEIAKFL